MSYGVQVGEERFFLKTAGKPDAPKPISHDFSISLLRNAQRLWEKSRHPLLPELYQVIESPDGPLCVYEWADGELLGNARDRFRALPEPVIIRTLDGIHALHHQLIGLGWIAVDFYDGCLIYDFDRQALHVMDLDHYHFGPFTNEMGRMFGSGRFMAPEEYELGTQIDERTTVFTMGRTTAVLLSDNSLDRQPFRGNEAQYEVMCRACRENRDERYVSMAEFYTAWMDVR